MTDQVTDTDETGSANTTSNSAGAAPNTGAASRTASHNPAPAAGATGSEAANDSALRSASSFSREQSPCGCSGEQVERIYEYLDGALTVEDLKQIASHLENCEDCTHESELEQMIRTAVKRSCSETAPETLRVTIMDRIHKECGESPRS